MNTSEIVRTLLVNDHLLTILADAFEQALASDMREVKSKGVKACLHDTLHKHADFEAETIYVMLEKGDVELMLQTLTECGEDLEAMVENEYPESTRAAYPVQQRRYLRDIAIALEAQELAKRIADDLHLSKDPT